MLVWVCEAHIWICFFYIPFQDKERLAKTKSMPAKLRKVLATFGFSEMSFTDSAQCFSILDFRKNFENISKNLQIDPRFPGDWYVRKQNKLFDSAQCLPILDIRKFIFLTLCSVSLRRVWLRAVLACAESLNLRISPRRRIFKENHFNLFMRVWFMKKKVPKNLVTLPL